MKIRLKPEVPNDYISIKTRNRYLVINHRFKEFSIDDVKLIKETNYNNIEIIGDTQYGEKEIEKEYKDEERNDSKERKEDKEEINIVKKKKLFKW